MTVSNRYLPENATENIHARTISTGTLVQCYHDLCIVSHTYDVTVGNQGPHPGQCQKDWD